MSREAYWREAFEVSMEDAGCGDLLKQMTSAQIDDVAGGIQGCHENIGLAFYTPESPLIRENERLSQKLLWQRELETCEDCKGSGRLRYNAGPWAVDSSCTRCSNSGKVHPRGEREPA